MSEADKKTVKWYYKPVWVIVGILAAGPFALPLVWFSPELKKWSKILLTIVTVLATLWLAKATIDIFRAVMKEMTDLQTMLK